MYLNWLLWQLDAKPKRTRPMNFHTNEVLAGAIMNSGKAAECLDWLRR